MACVITKIENGKFEFSTYGYAQSPESINFLPMLLDKIKQFYNETQGTTVCEDYLEPDSEEEDYESIDVRDYRTNSQVYLDSKANTVHIDIPVWKYLSPETTINIVFADKPTEEFYDLVETFTKQGFSFYKPTEFRYVLGVPKVFDNISTGKALAQDLYYAGYEVEAVVYFPGTGMSKVKLNFLGE